MLGRRRPDESRTATPLPSILFEEVEDVVRPESATGTLDPTSIEILEESPSVPTDVIVPEPQEYEPPERRVNNPSKLDKALENLELLVAAAETRQRYDEAREMQVRKLYDELDEYKRDSQLDRMLDLARGVILVVDKLDPEIEHPIPIEFVREELLECLAAVGIERLQEPVGTLDPLSEGIAGYLDESDPRGFRIRQDGYAIGTKVVRRRQVEIKRGPQP
jgi:hypothetical protein